MRSRKKPKYTFIPFWSFLMTKTGFLFLGIGFFLFPGLLIGQKNSIEIIGIQDFNTQTSLTKNLERAKDSLTFSEEISLVSSRFQQKGYLEFSLDSIIQTKDKKTLFFHQGPLYLIGDIDLEGLSEIYWDRGGFGQMKSKNKTVNWSYLEGKLRYCTDLLQNDGYPFAAFSNLQVDYQKKGEDTIWTKISYTFDPGPLIKIDSIRIRGNHRERDQFIYNLIRLSPGQIYDQSAIKEIPKILNNSIYYQKVEEPKIRFTSFKTARLDIDLESKKAGKLDILFGILPPTTNSQRLQFTGSMDILLVSPMKFGERIAFKYNQLLSSSRQINMDVMIPYLFRIPLKAEAKLDLFRQEEDFLNINFQGAGLFEFSPFLAARFYVKNRSSRLLDSAFRDTASLNFSQLDGNRQLFGLGLQYENLDYKLNPSRGWSAFLEVGVGRRTIRENFLLKTSYPEIYQDIDLQQPVNEVDLKVNWYKSLFPRHVVHLANKTYWLGMKEHLRNDQIQVGGSRSIRGFNENEFFTDFYSFFTAEYRFQLERDSYMFLFGDYAYLENNEQNKVRHPAGFGFGMNYGTKAGIISLTYAIGWAEDIPFQPARGKIHIGFINQF